MKSLIKKCVFLSLIGGSALLLSGCFDDKKQEVTNEVKQVEVASTTKSFGEILSVGKEKYITEITNALQRGQDLLKETFNTDTKGKITLSYGDSVGTISFDYLGLLDKSIDSLFGSLNFGIEGKKLSKISPMLPDELKTNFSADGVFNNKNSFIKLNDIEIGSLGSYFMMNDDKEFLKKFNKIKGKWIRFSEKSLCNEKGKEYSEELCSVSKSLTEFKNNFVKTFQEGEENNLKVVQFQKDLTKVFVDSLNSLFVEENFDNIEKTTKDGKNAYSFTIKEDKFKQELKKGLINFYSILLDNAKLFELNVQENCINKEDKKCDGKEEMKKEFEKGIDRFISSISLRNFKGYLIENENGFDIDVENLEIQINKNQSNTIKKDVEDKKEEKIEDIQDVDGKEIEIKEDSTTMKFSYSSMNKKIGLTFIEGESELSQFNISYEDTQEGMKYIIEISPTLDGKKIEGGISITSVVGTEETEKKLSSKSHSIITIKKDLFEKMKPMVDIKSNIVVTIESESFTESGKGKLEIPDTSKSTSVFKIDQMFNGKKENNDLPLQKKIDGNLKEIHEDIKK